MLRRAAFSLAVLAVVTACDAEPTSPTPTPTPTSTPTPTTAQPTHAAAVREGVAALYAGVAPSADEAAESACFADALLERLDPAALVAAGIVTDGRVVPVLPVLGEPTAEAWVAAQRSCADFVDVSTRALVAQSKGKVAPEAYRSCLGDALTDAQVDAALVDTLTGTFDSAEVAALSRAQADCARAASPVD